MEFNLSRLIGWVLIGIIFSLSSAYLIHYIYNPFPPYLAAIHGIIGFIGSYLLLYLKENSLKKFYGFLTSIALLAIVVKILEGVSFKLHLSTTAYIVLGVLGGIGISIFVIVLFYQEE